MIPPKYNATKDLFRALIDAKRDFGRNGDDVEESPPTLRSSDDDSTSGSSREGLFADHD